MQYFILNMYDQEFQEGFESVEAAQIVADEDSENGCEEDQVVLVVGEDDIVLEVHFHNGDTWQLDEGAIHYDLVGKNVKDI